MRRIPSDWNLEVMRLKYLYTHTRLEYHWNVVVQQNTLLIRKHRRSNGLIENRRD